MKYVFQVGTRQNFKTILAWPQCVPTYVCLWMSSVVWFFHDSFQTQASADLKNVLQVPQKKCNIYPT